MKAIYLSRPREIGIKEIAAPKAGGELAIIKIMAAGICGSDVNAYKGSNPLVSYPRVIGHELAGEVVYAPENSRGIKKSDRVVIDPYLYCGSCYPCSIGRTNCCTSLCVLGVHTDGGMAELFAHPADMLVKIPDNMPWEKAVLAEPLTISLHGLHRAGLRANEAIAIFGAGTIGLLAAMAAAHYGASPVLIDPDESRLAFGEKLGVKHLLKPGEALADEIAQITGGAMAQVVMEASGANSAILSSIEIASHAGRVIFTGWPTNATLLPTGTITKKELDIRGARTSAGEFEEALELINSGEVDAEKIVSAAVDGFRLGEMLEKIAKAPGEYLKVIGLFT